MIGDLTTTMPPPVQAPPLISRRALALFGTIAVLWTVLAWFAIEQQLQDRTMALVAQQTKDIQQAVVVISDNVDRVYNRLQ